MRYIVEHDVKIPSIYGSIVDKKTNSVPLFGFDDKCVLETTGEKRTGCIFCPIGAHLHKPNRFQRLKETHPELYQYCMTELGLDKFLTAVGVPH